MPAAMTLDEVAPDLREPTRRLRSGDVSNGAMRAVSAAALRVVRFPIAEGVRVRDVRAGRVRLRTYVPRRRLRDGALLWVHGGGLVIGDARQDDPLCSGTAAEVGIPVVSVNYRLAPRHPFPAAIEDLRTGWAWLHGHSAGLNIDPARVVVGGESAGGGLAAALVQWTHDLGGVQPAGQWLFAPMLDDRTAADTSLDARRHFVWDNVQNRFGWCSYLGVPAGAAGVPEYAAAARRLDLAGLPPAFIAVGSIELFRAEDERYAERLRAAGVEAELDLVEGAPHGFENWARTTPSAVALLQRARAWLGRHV